MKLLVTSNLQFLVLCNRYIASKLMCIFVCRTYYIYDYKMVVSCLPAYLSNNDAITKSDVVFNNIMFSNIYIKYASY